MKFSDTYAKYVETQKPFLPCLSYERLELLLLKHNSPEHNRSTLIASSSSLSLDSAESSSIASQHEHISCPASACSECDDAFFPLLTKEVTAVSRFFDTRVQQLLRVHLSPRFQKYILRLKYRHLWNRLAMIQEGQSLLQYVLMNTLATRKILKKYDKVHISTKGSAFKTWLQAMHVEVVQSTWLVELIAFFCNSETDAALNSVPKISPGCISYDFQSSTPTISCMLHDSIRLEINVTCSICLEVVFDPVALRCGHIFCNSCASSAASVITVRGLKTASRNAKCPLCRQTQVYATTVRLTELAILIIRSFPDYWKARLQRERVERLRQAREYSTEYWNNLLVGF